MFPLSVVATVDSGHAENADRVVSIHGFGGWAYGDTDGNRYLSGSESGEYENVNLSLALTASPTDSLRVSSQIELYSDPLGEDEAEVEIDYAFAEWTFNDRIRGRIGRGQHPFGIYSEVFDVGTLRPFFDLPQGLYGPSGIAGESYDGAGLTVTGDLGEAWEVQLDVYAGSLHFEAFEPWDGLRDEPGAAPGDDEDEALIENKDRDDLVGLRLALRTPVDGLSLGFSAYSGTAIETEDLEEGEEGENASHVGLGVHVEYMSDRLTVRAEAAHLDEEDEIEADAAYLEVAFMLSDSWELAVRYDWSDVDIEEVDVDEVPSLAEHRDLAFGVGYWFSPEMVVKLSVHLVEGNRFAVPEEVDFAVDTGTLETDTVLVTLGAQFSF